MSDVIRAKLQKKKISEMFGRTEECKYDSYLCAEWRRSLSNKKLQDSYVKNISIEC